MIKPCEYIIVANGCFPTTFHALNLLQNASYIIACDGAAESLYVKGFSPSAIIGDLDSIPYHIRKVYGSIIHKDSDQENNDLTKAVEYVKRKGIEEVIIVGATGLREDHTLGNISLLSQYIKDFKRIEMVTDFGWFTPLKENSRFPCYKGQQISIFSLQPSTLITSTGLRWPLKERAFTSWWQGTLNEAVGNTFTLRFSSGGDIILFRTFPKS